MSEKYLLPCSCGEQLTVERRQAGELVTCKCGKTLEVPTIRGFANLERAPEAEEAPLPPIWGLRQGLIFLGLVIALPAFAFAGYCYAQMPTLNETGVVEWSEALTPAESWMWWRQYENGMPKKPTITTAAVMKGVDSLNTKINIALLSGAIGIVVAASSLLVGGKKIEAGTPRTAKA